ncbi:MAG: polyprenyl synthetase family protein, partial [Aquihabitans sp.]
MAGSPPTHQTGALPAELGAIATRVEGRITTLLSEERTRWGALDPGLVEPLEILGRLVLTGGKRLRPVFCHWGFVAAGGDPTDTRIVDAGAAFELLQGFALVHDDIMDGSATRRRLPAVHRHFLSRHEQAGWAGESRRFGEGVAILVGDLAFVYADLLLPTGHADVSHIWNEL